MNKDKNTDIDMNLYNEYLQGNKEAFEILYNKYKSNIHYFIFNIVKDYEKAEDIMQEVFIYVLQNKVREGCSFKYYIYLVAKSRAYNYINVEKRREELNEEYQILVEDEIHKDVSEIILKEETKKNIKEAIDMLDDKYKNAIYLTKIEEFSYKETAEILGESIENVKTLVHRGKKELRKILISKGYGNMNKALKIFIFIILATVVLGGITYAGIKLYERIKGEASITPAFTGQIGNLDTNSVWIGSFQLAWNEFLEQKIGGNVEFEDGKSELADELNKKVFTKDMISDDSYYVKVGETSPELKNEILNDISNRFGIEEFTILDGVNFEKAENSYTIYSLLYKNFEFITPFDKLEASKFSDYEDLVQYFGINNASSEDLNKNVEVLFYNNENDFAVTLKTKKEDEVILYKTKDSGSFNNLYQEVVEKTNTYSGKKEFTEEDELKIPYINVDTVINYDELCGRFIKNENGLYIANALQNVKFSLNEKGGNLTSESGIKSEYMSVVEKARYFYFNDEFVLFMKEKDKELPYFALKIDNLDVLTLQDDF